MSIAEIEREMEKYRNQLENQCYKITPAQMRRWKALKRLYKKANIEIAK